MPTTKSKRMDSILLNKLAPLAQQFGPIEYREISSFKPYSNNPRKHPERQIVKLAASIREFGFVMPVLVDEGSTIIAGEARVEAAKRISMTKLPTLVADCWSAAQVRAYRLVDNRLSELAHWDDAGLAIELAELIEFDEMPIDILGWETAEIDLIIEGGSDDEASVDPADEPVEPPTIPVSRTGDLWLLGGHRLLCGSSLEAANWSRLMGGHMADMVFTDFPYNVPMTGHVCGLGKVTHAEFAMASGEMSKAQFTDFLTEGIQAVSAHIREGAVIDLCMDWRHIGEMQSAIDATGLTLINLCIWNKSNGGMGSLYRSKHELVFIARKGKTSHINNVELGKHGRYRTNVWDYAGVNSFGKNRMADLADHPTVKPVALVADAIRDVTKPGQIVLDGFMGSGTSILAAERTKRRCFGIDIDPSYIDVAIRRWEAMTGNDAVLASTNDTFAETSDARAGELIGENADATSSSSKI